MHNSVMLRLSPVGSHPGGRGSVRGWVWHPLTTCRLTLKPGAVAAISWAVAAGSWAVAAGSEAVAAGSWVVAAGSWVLAAGSCPVAAAAGLGWAGLGCPAQHSNPTINIAAQPSKGLGFRVLTLLRSKG